MAARFSMRVSLRKRTHWLNARWPYSKSPLHKRMEGEGGGGAGVAAVVAAALPPGHALGDCDPETQEGLEQWLKTLGGKIAADAAPFLKLLEDEGVFCLRDLNCTENELHDMGFPRALARRVHEGARALFNAQGWYLGSAAQATPPILGQVIETNAGAPARARSGHISALPPKPVFDLCSGMMSDQRDAVKAIDKLIQWSNGWADTLNTTLRVMKDEPKLTYAQILAHHTVRGNPPDAEENKMFASKLYTEWSVDEIDHVPDGIATGESGLHMVYELMTPSLQISVGVVTIDYIQFLSPDTSATLKCTNELTLFNKLNKWRDALDYFIADGRRPKDDMILHSLQLLCKKVAKSKIESMRDSKKYNSWSDWYDELREYANRINIEERDRVAERKNDEVIRKRDEEKKKKKEEEKKKARANSNPTPNSKPSADSPDPNPSVHMPLVTKNPCNNWMLLGSCANGDNCRYSHEGKAGEVLPMFNKPCKNNPCTRTYCPFQHTPGQFKGAGKGGVLPARADFACEKVGSAHGPNPNPQVSEQLGLGCTTFPLDRSTHSSPSKLKNRRAGKAKGNGGGAREEVFNTDIINESPHGDDNEFYNNDDDYDTVMNVIKLVLDSAATDDVMSKNDSDASLPI